MKLGSAGQWPDTLSTAVQSKKTTKAVKSTYCDVLLCEKIYKSRGVDNP